MIDDLRSFELLSHFSDAQLRQLEGCSERRSLPERSTLFCEGQSSFDVYLLREGRARVQRSTPYGDFDLGRIEPGSLFGEQGFVDRMERNSSVESQGPVELLVLDPPSLEALAEIDPAFKQALYWSFWRSLSGKLRGANHRLLDFFEKSGDLQEPRGDLLRLPSESFDMSLAAKRSVFEEQRLSGMEINFLASLSREERFEPGHRIFRQGEEGDKMYVIVDGQVMISTVVPGAGEEALSFLERGDYFGEMALIDGQPRSADARAHPQLGAHVLGIPQEVVDGLLSTGRVSSMRLLELLCRMISKRLREVDEKLVGWFLVAAADPKSRPELISQL